MVKKLFVSVIVILITFSMSLGIYAEDFDEISDEFSDFTDSIPSDIAELLPDGIFSDNIDEINNGVKEGMSFDFFLDLMFEWLGLNFKNIIKNFALIVALLVLCSLLGMLKNTIKSESLGKVAGVVGSIAIMSAILQIATEPIDQINNFIESTTTIVNTSTPLVCSLYAMGGNVGTAVVQNYNMIAFLTIFQNVCSVSLKMLLAICMSLASASAFLPNINLRSISDIIKKVFTFFVGILMLVFSSVMSAQTLLASKADSFTNRTAKMFAGQIIPITGGTVGESLKTAGASMEYLRSTIGIGIIIVLLLLVVPTIISVWSYRLAFIATSSISELLGCENEGKTLSEMASIYGYVLAIISICSLCLLFLFTLFAKCTSALY